MVMAELRLLVVSANPLARGGMESMVGAMREIRVVGSGSVQQAASLAGQLHPEAVLVDVGDGQLEDLDVIARLATAQPELPIVAVGGGSQAVTVALSFGASALLPAAVDLEALRLALLAAAQGLVTIARPDLLAILPADDPVEAASRVTAESLTVREHEVLQLMAGGLTNRQIGRRLGISEHTVKFHAGSVLGKLSARSRAEAVARAIGLGWILV